MPVMPPTHRPRGGRQKREHDHDRGSSAKRGYDSKWRRARLAYLRDHPLCTYCEAEGMVTAATLIDHLYPHRWFEGIFWVRHWWVSCCDACHNGMKARIEAQGRAAIDALARRIGRPVMPSPNGGVGQKSGG